MWMEFRGKNLGCFKKCLIDLSLIDLSSFQHNVSFTPASLILLQNALAVHFAQNDEDGHRLRRTSSTEPLLPQHSEQLIHHHNSGSPFSSLRTEHPSIIVSLGRTLGKQLIDLQEKKLVLSFKVLFIFLKQLC